MGSESIGGVPVRHDQIQELADEAEHGCPPEQLRRRGRPTVGEGPTSMVPVRMDSALLDALTVRAAAENVTRSEAIRAAVRAWIDAA